MAKMQGVTNESLENFGDGAFRVVIDQHARDLISEIVTGGAVDRPIFWQLFVAGQNFFDDQINRAPILWQRNPQGLGAARLQLFKIFQRPIQTVRVIDAQASDSAAGNELQRSEERRVGKEWVSRGR